MKFLHIADLHIGKRYCELSLIEDQRYILEQILKIAEEEKPDGVLLAGDIYDKSVPSAEAVELLDWFLSTLSDKGFKVFLISGNHDSAERIAFGARLMQKSGVYASPVYDGNAQCITLHDGFGAVNVYLLPFIKPATVRRFFPDEKIESYTDAVGAAIRQMNVNCAERNVLVAHQFVTGSMQSGSEETVVGDLGNVDGSVFAPFDYVALGHIHGAQNVGGERLRYSGTPLKYSLSERNDTKSVTIAELDKKGDLRVRTLPLLPLHDVREIRGAYEEITQKSYYAGTSLQNDLVHVVLTDEEEIPDALGKLRLIYPLVMGVRYDNKRTQQEATECDLGGLPARSPMELFSALYRAQNNADMTDEQSELVQSLIERAWEEQS